MRTSIFAIAAAASLASAQNFGAEPKCASACLTSAISVAGCNINDEACQCGSGISAIQSAITPCLLSACNNADLESAAAVGFALCSSFSASLASVSAHTTTSSGSVSASTSTGASVVTTSSSSPVSTTSVTAVTTSVTATTSAPVTTSTSSSTSSSAASSSSSASSAAPVSTNAAPAIMASVGGLMGVAAAFVAAL